jgi:hypothetical protein
MPIVRITLPAEKRTLREKMRALGLGHREIAAEFARRYRLRPRAAWREAHGWSLREAAAQINAYTGQRDPSASRPGPLRTSPQPLPGLTPGDGTRRADRRLHPRDHRPRPARPPRRLRLTGPPAREPNAPTPGSALVIIQLPIWASPVLNLTCSEGRDRSWPRMPQPQMRPH